MNANSFAATKQAWAKIEPQAARLARDKLIDLFATRTG